MPGICSCITAPITVPINCRYHCSSITRAITDLRPETTASAPHFGTMYSGRCCADDLGPPTGHRDSPTVHAVGFFLANSGTFALFVGYDGRAAEPGNRQSRRMAARSHARAAFLCLRLPCAPGKYRANSEYTPRRLRERRFSTPSGLREMMDDWAALATSDPTHSANVIELRAQSS